MNTPQITVSSPREYKSVVVTPSNGTELKHQGIFVAWMMSTPSGMFRIQKRFIKMRYADGGILESDEEDGSYTECEKVHTR